MQQARRYRADARAGFWGWMSRRKIREKRKNTLPGRSSRPTWLARVEISRETKFSPPGESLEATRCRGNYRTNWNSDKKASKNLSAIEHVMRQDLEARSKRLRLHVIFALLLVEPVIDNGFRL